MKGLSEEEREKKFERLSSIGKPLPGVEIRIVDEDGTDVPTNEQGEIIASGPQLMKGYWQQDDVTAEDDQERLAVHGRPRLPGR